MKLCISAMLVINGLDATNLLNISDMRNFFHYNCFKKFNSSNGYIIYIEFQKFSPPHNRFPLSCTGSAT